MPEALGFRELAHCKLVHLMSLGPLVDQAGVGRRRIGVGRPAEDGDGAAHPAPERALLGTFGLDGAAELAEDLKGGLLGGTRGSVGKQWLAVGSMCQQ